MKRPEQKLLDLYEIGTIQGILVEYQQTGNDTAETFISLKGSNGNIYNVLASEYRRYLTIRMDYNSIAGLHDHYLREVDEWEKFEENNEAMLKEYYRLQRVLGL